MFYDSSLPTRRTLLVSGIVAFATTFLGSGARALGISAAEAAEDPPLIGADGPFQRSTVVEIARQLAKANYAPPPSDLPDPIKNLTYDELRDIRFKPAAAVWADTNLPFQLQLFHRGFYYKEEIDVAIVDDGEAHHLAYSPDMFTTGKVFTKPLPEEDIGFAGIRLHGRINSPDRFDEVAVFQGASYFRSLGKDQVYGLSARGLALKVGEPEGEEFPLFRAFWVEKPVADSDAVVVHALLDSPSVSGAYRFTIRPGLPTTMDVEATLFPRVDLAKVGLAPGTSMFFFSLNGRDGVDDWRPEVHDFGRAADDQRPRRKAVAAALQPACAADQCLPGYRPARLRPHPARPPRGHLPGFRVALRAAAEPLGRAGRRLGTGLGHARRDSERLGDQRQHRRLLVAEGPDSAQARNSPSPTGSPGATIRRKPRAAPSSRRPAAAGRHSRATAPSAVSSSTM